jgi:hypothetical protein
MNLNLLGWTTFFECKYFIRVCEEQTFDKHYLSDMDDYFFQVHEHNLEMTVVNVFEKYGNLCTYYYYLIIGKSNFYIGFL